MKNTNTNQTNIEVILKEILPLPSDKITINRFSKTAEAVRPDCLGPCSSFSGH